MNLSAVHETPRWHTVQPARPVPYFHLRSAHTGTVRSLHEFNAQRTILTFVPGVWAPWCRTLLSELNAISATVEQNNMVLLAIVSQHVHEVMEYMQAHPVNYEVLTDPHGAINTRYGVFDDGLSEPMKISKPAVFILDKNKHVQFTFMGKHLVDRPHAREILERALLPLPSDRSPSFWHNIFRRPNYAGN